MSETNETEFPRRIFARTREPGVPALPVEIPARAPIERVERTPERDASEYIPRRPSDAKMLTALADTLSQSQPDDALRTTAQCIFDLRFHQLIELCNGTIARNADQLKIEAFDLATGLSGWAIETLAKTDP